LGIVLAKQPFIQIVSMMTERMTVARESNKTVVAFHRPAFALSLIFHMLLLEFCIYLFLISA
jgi:hypothetical protein